MQRTERSVLHVLPHAGGGGEMYVNVVEEMEGYRFRRVYVTPQRKPAAGELAAGARNLARALRGYDLLHVHGEGTAGLLLPLLAVRPSVVTLHGLHLLRRVTGLRRRAAEANLHAIVRAASRTICVSEAERDQLASVVGARAMRRVVVIHNGARVPAAQRRAPESNATAIWVGSLDERRDPFVAVRAAMRTETPFLIVGDGPLRAEVERVARPPVQLLGLRDDVASLLDAADFFVLVSQREGFSFALLEAMAHGLPAIVVDVPENLEAIGDTGIAVPYADDEALVAAFRRFAKDADARVALGERARARVAKLFNARDMIERTRALYDEVLGARSV